MDRSLVMPRYLGRFFYAFRGKRKVRLQIIRNETDEITIEGILVGRWASHYILLFPKLIKDPENSIELEGSVEIPEEKVLFVQVI